MLNFIKSCQPLKYISIAFALLQPSVPGVILHLSHGLLLNCIHISSSLFQFPSTVFLNHNLILLLCLKNSQSPHCLYNVFQTLYTRFFTNWPQAPSSFILCSHTISINYHQSEILTPHAISCLSAFTSLFSPG